MTGAGISVVLLIMFFGLRAARRIAQPIQDLKSSVDRIAAQDYGARVAIASRDEIGLLGAAFNRMAEDLSISHAELVKHKRELENRVEYLAPGPASALRQPRPVSERLAKAR
jgi:nitrogen fixation/metabolism regulation signal transduction histidine kinase